MAGHESLPFRPRFFRPRFKKCPGSSRGTNGDGGQPAGGTPIAFPLGLRADLLSNEQLIELWQLLKQQDLPHEPHHFSWGQRPKN
jgi:hypothetical protein